MILDRISDFFDYFKISSERKEQLKLLAEEAALLADGMTDYKDYLALGALLEYHQPKFLFEIGTYKGVTTNFFLKVLPNCNILSLAYINPKKRFFSKKFNNSELTKEEVGSFVTLENQSRYTQLIGDSHKIDPTEFIQSYKKVDFIFIDGDHSAKGVELDTHLALKIMEDDALIAWHDANPKEKYQEVRHYLEQECPLKSIATFDDYIGGVAAHSQKIDQFLKGLIHVKI